MIRKIAKFRDLLFITASILAVVSKLLRRRTFQYVELTHLVIGRGQPFADDETLLSFVDCNRLLPVLPEGDSALEPIFAQRAISQLWLVYEFLLVL